MVDLCVGPHIPHTGKIKAFMVTKVGIARNVFDFFFPDLIVELCIIFPG